MRPICVNTYFWVYWDLTTSRPPKSGAGVRALFFSEKQIDKQR